VEACAQAPLIIRLAEPVQQFHLLPEPPANVEKVHYDESSAKRKPCDNTFIPTFLAHSSVRVLYTETHRNDRYFNPLNAEIILLTDPVRTSQETRYVSATKPNWLRMFGERVVVCCEKHINRYTFTLNITVFKYISFYSSTTCFDHIGPSSVTTAIIATAVSL
jgi:hypothetical protein